MPLLKLPMLLRNVGATQWVKKSLKKWQFKKNQQNPTKLEK